MRASILFLCPHTVHSTAGARTPLLPPFLRLFGSHPYFVCLSFGEPRSGGSCLVLFLAIAATCISFLSFAACGCRVAHGDCGETVASVAGVFCATAMPCCGCHHCGVAQCGREPNNPLFLPPFDLITASTLPRDPCRYVVSARRRATVRCQLIERRQLQPAARPQRELLHVKPQGAQQVKTPTATSGFLLCALLRLCYPGRRHRRRLRCLLCSTFGWVMRSEEIKSYIILAASIDLISQLLAVIVDLSRRLA
jgi:hypothetical protein